MKIQSSSSYYDLTRYQQMVDLPQVKTDLTCGRKTLADELSHKVAELLNKSNQKIRKHWESLKFGYGYRSLSIPSSKQPCLALVVKNSAKTDVKIFQSRPIWLIFLLFQKHFVEYFRSNRPDVAKAKRKSKTKKSI